jgi:hypothetical protein
LSSKHAHLFEGLPAPADGALTVYIFGPGFGESQVVALPDGKWLVVDSCKRSNVNFPLELLRHFNAPAIDLLAVTHADLDHYKGIPELITSFEVKRLWRYPGFQTSRDILIELEKEEAHPGFAELRAMQDTMRPLMTSVRGREAVYDTRLLPEGSSYHVRCIAPCSAEKQHESEQLSRIYKHVKTGRGLTQTERRYLMGEANRLSLAIVIWWGQVGVLLGGDVEYDEADDERGWRGVIGNLKEDGQLQLIQGLRVVKTAHHGSDSAFCEDAWREHAAGGLVELAVITRFSKGGNPPPQTSGLELLRRFARRLALTSEPGGGSAPILGGGWARIDHPSGPGAAACVAITLAEAPPALVALSKQGALFEAAPAGGAGASRS